MSSTAASNGLSSRSSNPSSCSRAGASVQLESKLNPGSCAANLHRIVRSRCLCRDAADRVQRKRERFRIPLRRKAQVSEQPELGRVGDAMHLAGEFVLAQHPRREVAGPAVQEQALQAEPADVDRERSEEHTSELQSRVDLVCRLLLEK